ncbi:MAG: DUF302 domain-containing protein [Candidatus Heimdallarchaeota archaeon]
MVNILRKQISMAFDDAVQHVEKLVVEAGFTILMTKAIDEVIKNKLGLDDYPRYTIILVCGPDLAKMALDASKNVGTFFHCSFVVFEEEHLEGKAVVAHVSIMKLASELRFASPQALAPVIAETSARVQALWQKI